MAEEVKHQAIDLLKELTTDLREQAGIQQEKIALNLRHISIELRAMVESAEDQGTAVSLVRQAAHRTGDAADWLTDRGPGTLLEEVKDFARHRPGAFLAIAAGAGLLMGRFARGMAGATVDESPHRPSTQRTSATELDEGPDARTETPASPVSDSGSARSPAAGSGGVEKIGGNPGPDIDPLRPAEPGRGTWDHDRLSGYYGAGSRP